MVIGNHFQITLPSVLSEHILVHVTQSPRPLFEQFDEVRNRSGENLVSEVRIFH